MSDLNIEIEPTGTQSEKRQRKLTLKGAALAFEKAHKERSELFKNAGKIKWKITELWSSNKNVSEVKQCMQRLNTLCENASKLHNSLLKDFNLSEDEQQKQNAWFQEKMLANDEFVNKVRIWLKESEEEDDVRENACEEVAADNVQTEEHLNDEGVNPEDSVSNITNVRSKRSSASSTSSARKQALADQAALLAKAEALKKKHKLEEQEQRHRLEADKIRQQKEQVEKEAQIAAAAARLSVLGGSSIGGKSKVVSDGMNSYVSKRLKDQRCTEINPKSKEFVPNIIISDAMLTAPHNLRQM
ncbi:uncharacterized protein LOC106512048 [Austrofundulus limnaeus]|uniref:Uncharacterized protein LOC106512048 n=1 Tax=Austrofundulus limnaeus TaxID=52670 RepID=A0A2I4AL37_AUSLI|nr:PREDICTED: uncharacterized protein LOC106512048 [Austrofundulus limnaeus]